MQQFAHDWLGLIVDISIKSLGLAVVAGLALFVLRVRDTNLRHRVWTAVLFGMLAMPALVFVTPAIPLPRWMNIAIPEATAETLPVGENADGRGIATPRRRMTDPTSDAMSVAASGSDAIPDPMMSGRLPPVPDGLRPAVANDLPTKDPVPAGVPVAGRPSVAVQIASRLPVVLASLYFAVAAIFAARLITGLWLTYRLIGRASEISRSRLPSGTWPDYAGETFSGSAGETRSGSASRTYLRDDETSDFWKANRCMFRPQSDSFARLCCCRQAGDSGAKRSCRLFSPMSWPTCGGPIGW